MRIPNLAAPLATAIASIVPTWTNPAHATDFHVIEAHAGYEVYLTGGIGDGHGSYGLGYMWDVFITHPTLRGAEVGVRADLLHCPSCDSAIDGGALLGNALVTFWKDDLSATTLYFGLAPGLGYTRQTDAVFLEGELQAALQFRALYEGWWVRPAVFAGAGGAYDGYASAGLRVSIGYSPNHGRRDDNHGNGAVRPIPTGACDPPERAELAATEERWVVKDCYRAGVSVRVDGQVVDVTDQGGDLLIDVGPGTSGATQSVEIEIAGGTFAVSLRRR